MASKVKDGNYVVIQSFMVKDLKLKGNELLIYAIIYGFSQDGENEFTGSLQYLCDWTNSTKRGVLNCLQSLVQRDLIAKKDIDIKGVKFVSYSVKKFTPIEESSIPPSEQSSMEGIEESSPNNILKDNIDIDNIGGNNNALIPTQPTPIKNKRFVKPTIEEIKAYCLERNNGVDPNRFYDYYESNGWKVGKNAMKDWKAAVRTWERGNAQAPKDKNNGNIFLDILNEQGAL